MANLQTLQNDVKALTYRGVKEFIVSQKDGISVKDILSHYAPRFEVNLEEKKERDILYRRVNRLLAAGSETDEIQKNGSKFVCMTPEEAEKYRAEQEHLAKMRASIVALVAESKVEASVTDSHVVMTFESFKKFAKPAKK